jgi:hypothetical protein
VKKPKVTKEVNVEKGKTGSMNSPKGLCSHSSNPLAQPSRTSSQCGPGMNPDQKRANSLLKQAYAEKESLRGKSGM